MQLQGQHVLILGLGASGLAMARWCARAGAEVSVVDTRDAPPQLAALQAEWPSVRFVAGPLVAGLVEGTSVRAVFRSPGLAPEVVAPVVNAAQAMGLWQGGELSLFAAAAAGVPAFDSAGPGEGDAFAKLCTKAARDGFAGKFALTPAQARAIKAAFAGELRTT